MTLREAKLMRNVVFGSGAVGLMAKKILSGDWDVVPFYKSRFYSYNPPLADNYIVRDQEIDDAIKAVAGQVSFQIYRRAYSASGLLVKEFDESVSYAWLSKIFDGDVPTHSLSYLKTRMASTIYDMRVTQVYAKLLEEFSGLLKQESAKGLPTEIGKHYFIRAGQRVDFDNAICTIPLPVLLKLIGVDGGLKSKNEHLVLVRSSTIDFEGCNQVFVADASLQFYKVVNVAKGLYMFSFLNDISNPGAYLLQHIGAADIVDGTCIPNGFLLGQMSDLTWLADYGIFCIGSHAQNDWCADIGSNVLRLVRYAARGYKP